MLWSDALPSPMMLARCSPQISSASISIPPVLAARTGRRVADQIDLPADGGRRFDFHPRARAAVSGGRHAQTGRRPCDSEVAGIDTRARSPLGTYFPGVSFGDSEFGLPIETVIEVAQVPAQITRLPKTPKFLEGIVNLRGDVLPVIDQRRRFDMPTSADIEGRKLVVITTERHRAGLIVDSVSDVLRAHAEDVAPPPDLTDATNRLVKVSSIWRKQTAWCCCSIRRRS